MYLSLPVIASVVLDMTSFNVGKRKVFIGTHLSET